MLRLVTQILFCEILASDAESIRMLPQVLVRAPSDMLAVDVVRRVRDGDPLPDGLLRLLRAHLPRLLHHVRAPLHPGETNHGRSRVPSVPEPHRLQGCSSLLHSKYTLNLKQLM